MGAALSVSGLVGALVVTIMLPFALACHKLRPRADLGAQEQTFIEAHTLVDVIPLHFEVFAAGRVKVTMRGLMVRGPLGAGDIVMLHGVASASASFVHMFEALSRTHNVYALDLPGFGRSHTSRGVDAEFVVEVLEGSRRALGLDRAVWVGHSFGAFICIKYAHAHPSRVDRLVLMNAVGIFPTLGVMGAYWGVAFKLSVPNAGRWLGVVGRVLVAHSPCWSADDIYWWEVASNPRNYGGGVVAGHVSLSPLGAAWKDPAFNLLAALNMPVCLIYGERDAIIPPHQGWALHSLLAHQLVLIPGAGHSSAGSPQNAKLVCASIAEFLRSTRVAPAQPKTLPGGSFRSSFLPSDTARVISGLYTALGGRELSMSADLTHFCVDDSSASDSLA